MRLRPANPYGNLFRGSSRLLKGHAVNDGVGDLDYAIALGSPDVHYVVADAYTYGLPDPNRAFTEATLALEGGLNTPRVHAILGSAYLAFGNVGAAAAHIQTHIQLVATGLVTTPALPAGTSLEVGLVPGQTLDIPLVVSPGEKVSIVTSSDDSWKYSPPSTGLLPRAGRTGSGSHSSRVSLQARCAYRTSKQGQWSC